MMDPVAEENVEVVRRTLETFPTDEEGWLATLDPEFEWHPIEEVIADGDAVVSTLHIVGRGRESGIPVEIRIHMQWRVRDGLITYMYEHADRAAALRAAGLD